jgi:hypothetical protein
MYSPSSSFRSAVSSDVSRMNGDFISLGEALKLVTLFKGNKQEFRAFIENVNTASL